MIALNLPTIRSCKTVMLVGFALAALVRVAPVHAQTEPPPTSSDEPTLEQPEQAPADLVPPSSAEPTPPIVAPPADPPVADSVAHPPVVAPPVVAPPVADPQPASAPPAQTAPAPPLGFAPPTQLELDDTSGSAPSNDFSYAIRGEFAHGATGGDFQNGAIGVRLQYAFSERVLFGGHLGIATLKGKSGRVAQLLPYAQVAYRLPVSWGALTHVPLRFASGYLPDNGPIARVSAGLSFALSESTDLVAEVLSPMVWVTNDQTLLSMNLALELVFRSDP